MKQTAVEWYAEQMQLKEKFTQEEFDNITNQAKEIEKQQQDNFAIDFAEWKDINCVYYDGWNIKVPLGDKYSDVYTNEELLEIYKKEQFKNK